MKKLISLCLTVCLIFLVINTISANFQSNNNEDLVLNLHTASEFGAKLASENIDPLNSDAYEISVLIELDDILDKESLNFDAMHISTDADDIDDELEAHRNRVKEYYVEYNESVVSTLGLDDYEYCISYYSPYIEIVFDDIAEYSRCENELVSDISNHEFVSSACNTMIIYENSREATIDSISDATNYLLSDAFDDIGVSDSSYTGDGVKVGIIDFGVPDTTNLKEGKYTLLPPEEEDDHSTIIASIIGGTSGIAEDVYFYCMKQSGFLINDCNVLAGAGANIINMSLTKGMVGYYSNYDACIDNFVSTTGCTFVKSAGNRGEREDKYITQPGCALNAITVGSINKSHNISSFSSWNVTDSFLLKPDVVAPGGRLWDIPNIPNETYGHYGTSYSAPMVVGTIALLMEEFPELKINPALVKSVLHLGAEKLPSQTNYFDQQAGFGLLNYQNMRDCLLDSSYANFAIPATASEGDIVASYPITLSYLNQVFIHANSIINSSNTTLTTDQTSPVYTDYAIKVLDLSTNTYVATSTIDSNVDYLNFANNNQNNSSFRIDIVLTEDSASDAEESGSFAVHTHSFGRYTYHNNTSHIRHCACGESMIEGHYIRQGSIVNNRYAICLGCLTQLDFLEDSAYIIASATQVSVNGSYILPSGIVVLVDEDIQAYLDGTLVFYPPDNVPSTQ